MRLEEDASWPAKPELDYIELWFNLPVNQRRAFALAFETFERDLIKAKDPMAFGSGWSPKLKRWTHDIPPLRFTYLAYRDRKSSEWVAIIDTFYLIDVSKKFH